MTGKTHRTSQPRRGAVLSDSPLARGIVAFQTGDNIREFTHSGGTPAVANTRYGRAQTLSNESLTKSITSRSAGSCTIASIFRVSTTSFEQALGSLGGSGNAFLLYLVGGTQPYMWNAATQVGSGVNIAAGEWHTAVGRSGPSLCDIWVDGQYKAGNTTGATYTVDTAAVGGYWVSGSLNASYRFRGDAPLTVIWDRVLSDAEVREWFRNPWQIFRQAPSLLDRFSPATSITSNYPAIFDRHLVSAAWFSKAMQGAAWFDRDLVSVEVTTPLVTATTYTATLTSVAYTIAASQLFAARVRVATLNSVGYSLAASPLVAARRRVATLSSVSYTLSPTGLTATRVRVATLQPVAYSFAPQALAAARNRTAVLASTSYTLSPQALTATRVRVAALQSVAYAWSPTSLVANKVAPGSYTATLTKVSYTLGPQSLVVARNRVAVPQSVSYSLNPQPINALRVRVAQLQPANFVVTPTGLVVTIVPAVPERPAHTGAGYVVYYKGSLRKVEAEQELEEIAEELGVLPVSASPEDIEKLRAVLTYPVEALPFNVVEGQIIAAAETYYARVKAIRLRLLLLAAAQSTVG